MTDDMRNNIVALVNAARSQQAHILYSLEVKRPEDIAFHKEAVEMFTNIINNLAAVIEADIDALEASADAGKAAMDILIRLTAKSRSRAK